MKAGKLAQKEKEMGLKIGVKENRLRYMKEVNGRLEFLSEEEEEKVREVLYNEGN